MVVELSGNKTAKPVTTIRAGVFNRDYFNCYSIETLQPTVAIVFVLTRVRVVITLSRHIHCRRF